MNTSTDNDFSELRRLLSLKRHEQPPPGYFDDFSRTVIARLKEERRGRARRDASDSVPRWIVHLVDLLQAHPVFAFGLGAAMCALLIGSLLVYENDTQAPANPSSLISQMGPGPQAPAGAEVLPAEAFQPVTAEAATPLMVSNNLQSTPNPSLFDEMPGIETVPVDHRP